MSEMRSSSFHHQVSNESSLVEKVVESSPTNGTVRRKLERFRSKLIELFFTTSSSSASSTSTSPASTPPLTPVSPTSTTIMPPALPPPSTTSMSTYYFGYTTTGRMMHGFDATSTTSSSLTYSSEDSNSSSASSASLPVSMDVQSSASNNALGPVYNPFLDSIASKSIHLNSPDLIQLKEQFEPFLCTIDDEDNFFDAEFMSAYIAYSLVTRLRDLGDGSIELRQAGSSNNNNNLVRDIAREIFAQSESEPCGLKGCRINVILETLPEQTGYDEDDYMSSASQPQQILLDRFRFDSTCLLTTFELNLVLKQVKPPPPPASSTHTKSTSSRNGGRFYLIDVNNNQQHSANSTTGRKTKSVRFGNQQRSSPVNDESAATESSSSSTFPVYRFIDDSQFFLYKCSLY